MAEGETCGAVFRPPRLYLGALIVGFLFDLALGVRLDQTANIGLGFDLMAYSVTLLGLAIFVWGLVTFRKHDTPVPTIEASRVLVTTGPYRFSRNPIYLGMTILYLGLTLSFHGVAALIFLPGILIAMHRGVILQEEAYLHRRFGADYEDYLAHTNRWFGFKGLMRRHAA